MVQKTPENTCLERLDKSSDSATGKRFRPFLVCFPARIAGQAASWCWPRSRDQRARCRLRCAGDGPQQTRTAGTAEQCRVSRQGCTLAPAPVGGVHLEHPCRQWRSGCGHRRRHRHDSRCWRPHQRVLLAGHGEDRPPPAVPAGSRPTGRTVAAVPWPAGLRSTAQVDLAGWRRSRSGPRSTQRRMDEACGHFPWRRAKACCWHSKRSTLGDRASPARIEAFANERGDGVKVRTAGGESPGLHEAKRRKVWETGGTAPKGVALTPGGHRPPALPENEPRRSRTAPCLARGIVTVRPGRLRQPGEPPASRARPAGRALL